MLCYVEENDPRLKPLPEAVGGLVMPRAVPVRDWYDYLTDAWEKARKTCHPQRVEEYAKALELMGNHG